MKHLWDRLSTFVTGRRGAWAVLIVTMVIVAAIAGTADRDAAGGAGEALPPESESARAQQLLEQFPGSETTPVMAVFAAKSGELSDTDLAAIDEVGSALADTAGHETGPPVTSEDGEIAFVNVPISSDLNSEDNVEAVEELRAAVNDEAPDTVTAYVTGGPAFGADITSSFDGANLLLLAVTVAVVALLLLLTYRSPVLWLVPLAVVAVAAELATSIDGQLAAWFDLKFDSGIISVLVFGAGTNYALLLISRYREELRRFDDRRHALLVALRATAPAILASNATVVLALATLIFATVPSSSGLGVAAAVGLMVALLFGLFVLPAALAVCGRGLFWPFIPRYGDVERGHTGLWGRLARAVVARPVRVLAATVALLAVLAAGMSSFALGLSQTEQFRVEADSVHGYEELADHFPVGLSEPMMIVADAADTENVVSETSDVDGVTQVTPVGEPHDGRAKIMAVADAEPGSADSRDIVRDVREAAGQATMGEVLVGGQAAQDLDGRDAAIADLKTVVPLVLIVVFVILVLLLRSLLAPILLSLVNVASAIAAIGAGTWIGVHVFGLPALDVNVPLLAFLFLAALGIDYTIFLVTRAREEAGTRGTAAGMAHAVATTGGVITSAGVVLAAVFAALGVLPLMTLAQLGLIVCIGVLIDTTVVRTLAIPALFAMIGPKIWWPAMPDAASGGVETPQESEPEVDRSPTGTSGRNG